MKKIIFVHIPKTAGSSVLAYLIQAYGKRERLRLRNQDNSLPTVEEKDVKLSDFIWLHAPLRMLKYDVSPFFRFTVLRDPVQRVKSVFYFLRNPDVIKHENFDFTPKTVVDSLREIEKMSFQDFLTSEDPVHKNRITNIYAQYFYKGVEGPSEEFEASVLQSCFDYMRTNFQYVGLTHTLDQDMQLLREICFPEFQKPFGDLRRNISVKKGVDTELDSNMLEILHKKLHYDIPIFDYACDLREKLYLDLKKTYGNGDTSEVA